MERDSLGRFVSPNYKYNKEYFTVPNMENCYWAGFLAADGTITRRIDDTHDEYNVELGLSKKDITHIEKFAKTVDTDCPIKTGKTNYKDSEYARITFYQAKQWHEDLLRNFSLTPRKSLTLQPLNITDEQLALSYIRGYIDGDGSIYKSSIRGKEYTWISLMSTLQMCHWIKAKFEELAPNPRNSLQIYPRKNNFIYQFYGKRADIIYSKLVSLNTPYLERKWSLSNGLQPEST